MRDLNYRSLISLAIAEGATTPNPGFPTWAWSTTLNKPVYWDGDNWTAGTGGGGSAFTKGTTTLVFPPFPGAFEQSIVVTALGISAATSFTMAKINPVASVDRSVADHMAVTRFLTISSGGIIDGLGFTIYGRSSHPISGTFNIAFMWG